MPTVLELAGVSKRFELRHTRASELKVRVLGWVSGQRRHEREEFWALRGVSLRLDRGETLGIVGRNGSGKSTLLKLVAAIHCPTEGRVLVARGARITSLIELGVGFHPELTGRENVALNAAIHGLSGEDVRALYPAIVEYAGLEHFMDVPLKNYSSGMHMRLGFAVAAHLDPDLLLLDEIFAVGDEAFQQKCLQTLRGLQARGCTILFVSHSAAAIRAISTRVAVLRAGELCFDGGVDAGLATYRALVAAEARASAARAAPEPAPEEDADRAWHRTVLGDHWDELGRWAFDFARRQGLAPHHYFLDVGCGSLSAARFFLPFLEPYHYWGFEQSRALFDAGVRFELARAGVPPEWGHFVVNDTFDLSEIPDRFDMAIANSLIGRLSLDGLARCLAAVVGHLRPDGRFFLTWREPDTSTSPGQAGDSTAHEAAGGQPAAPRQYRFALIAAMCDAVGASVERLDDTSHPRGEAVAVIRRRR